MCGFAYVYVSPRMNTQMASVHFCVRLCLGKEASELAEIVKNAPGLWTSTDSQSSWPYHGKHLSATKVF